MSSKDEKNIDIRDRITSVEEKRLSDIEKHPHNPKDHTTAQSKAIKGVVKEVGWAGVPLVYYSERNGGKLTFVDGHLRQQEFPEATVKVAITDLNDDEADYLLLTYDPISWAGKVNEERVLAIMDRVQIQNEDVLGLIQSAYDGAYTVVERPDFSGLVEEFKQVEGKGKPEGDEKWFYVEYYGDQERWDKLHKLLSPHFKGQTKHELEGDLFYNMVMSYFKDNDG